MAYRASGLLSRINLKNYDLLPLVGIIGTTCVLAFGFSTYSLLKKSDVVIARRRNPFPWQNVDSAKPQKLVSINQKWESTPSIENLRKDIGG